MTSKGGILSELLICHQRKRLRCKTQDLYLQCAVNTGKLKPGGEMCGAAKQCAPITVPFRNRASGEKNIEGLSRPPVLRVVQTFSDAEVHRSVRAASRRFCPHMRRPGKSRCTLPPAGYTKLSNLIGTRAPACRNGLHV